MEKEPRPLKDPYIENGYLFQQRKGRKRKLIALFLCCLIPVCYFVGPPDSGPNRRSGKYYASDAQQKPSALPNPIQGENQTEGHTCGLHSLSAIYKSYSLDPAAADLRFRLGVDRRANPFDATTLGTVQPDILRVVHQDGFATAVLDLQDPVPARRHLQNHLESGHYALTLIRRRQSGNLHWVVISAWLDNELTVVDSLTPQPYTEPVDDFMTNHVLSVMLLQPAVEDASRSIFGNNMRGIQEMKDTYQRMGQTN
ncbi:hypothetical protein [Acanthopleuribacter pedis]|uniref:Peptidase C39 domain-containing protein n=1 Tax=Acanthopleuribacter pedis TaxID=442870 RepID=A0A8J7U6J5_9BACT|nr:hypothetical protein [Acanthopleuribacter pedis]MBO1320436.1 hypothetical protein [Acanthopleuribacter pedis]